MPKLLNGALHRATDRSLPVRQASEGNVSIVRITVWETPGMQSSELICCFCGRKIESGVPDPCTLELRTSRDVDEAQELKCHADCLNEAVHSDMMLLTQM